MGIGIILETFRNEKFLFSQVNFFVLNAVI